MKDSRLIESNKKSTVFLTGATGLVGSYLLKTLLKYDYRVSVLARSKNKKSAEERVFDMLAFWNRGHFRKTSNLEILEGDITKDNFGINEQDFVKLKEETEEIIHCAAITSYKWPLEDIRNTNILGTKRILDFALQCKKNGNFKKVNHISTAYVCGDFTGTFKENDLDVGQKFNNPYEQSKFDTEKLIQEYRKNTDLWIDIIRPCAVVGESTSGKINSFYFNFYRVLHIWSLEVFDFFPGKGYFINIVPVDELAESIVTIIGKNTEKNKNFHTFRNMRLPLEQIMDAFYEFTRYKMPMPVTITEFSKKNSSAVQKKLIDSIFGPFNGYVILDSSKTEEFLKEHNFNYSEIDQKLLFTLFEYFTKIHIPWKGA